MDINVLDFLCLVMSSCVWLLTMENSCFEKANGVRCLGEKTKPKSFVTVANINMYNFVDSVDH